MAFESRLDSRRQLPPGQNEFLSSSHSNLSANDHMQHQSRNGNSEDSPSLKSNGEINSMACEDDPDQRLSTLQTKMLQLQREHNTLRKELLETSKSCFASLNVQNIQNHGRYASMSLSELVGSMTILNSVHVCLRNIQKLQISLRQAERLLKNVERCFKASGENYGLLKEVSDAVGMFCEMGRHNNALKEWKQKEDVSYIMAGEILNYTSVLDRRSTSAVESMRKLMQQISLSFLVKCEWPPPLMHDKAASVETWNGWELHPEELSSLEKLFVLELALQHSMQVSEFDCALKAMASVDSIHDIYCVQAPILWPAEELVVGVNEWIEHHFAKGLPTDRPDKPEWLFKAIIKIARILSPLSEVFQSCVDTMRWQNLYSIEFEVARAISAKVLLPILRKHILPRLTSINEHALWLHYVDEALSFEQSFAPLCGFIGSQSNAESMFDSDGQTSIIVAHPYTAIEVLFECDDWFHSWLVAEKDDLVHQLDASLQAPDAWNTASIFDKSTLDSLDSVTVGFSMPNGIAQPDKDLASQNEFHPPSYTDDFMTLLITLLQRSTMIYSLENRTKYSECIVKEIMQHFRSNLMDVLSRAHQFNQMLDPVGMQKIGAALCAAHYLEHVFGEPQNALLEFISNDSYLKSLLEKEATTLSLIRREYTNKVTMCAVESFGKDLNKYRSYAANNFSDVIPSGRRSNITQNHSASPNESLKLEPSTGILVLAEHLQSILRLFSLHFDEVIFRDSWRALATAINRFLFERIVTETFFSIDGAHQFSTDVDAILKIFNGVTLRPAAHFKEVLDGCRILMLPAPMASNFSKQIAEGVDQSLEALHELGIRSLNVEQARTILNQRV